ncbi:MAG: hypothetical protein ACOH5I_00475 [Oligoflexus sp.]
MSQRELSTSSVKKDSNVLIGAIWMFGLTMVLFFLPVINGLIGGLVGGYKIGSPGRAILAAILPAILASGGLWLLLAVLDLPVIGLIAGLAVGIVILLADLGIFLGAMIGGVMGRGTA